MRAKGHADLQFNRQLLRLFERNLSRPTHSHEVEARRHASNLPQASNLEPQKTISKRLKKHSLKLCDGLSKQWLLVVVVFLLRWLVVAVVVVVAVAVVVDVVVVSAVVFCWRRCGCCCGGGGCVESLRTPKKRGASRGRMAGLRFRLGFGV